MDAMSMNVFEDFDLNRLADQIRRELELTSTRQRLANICYCVERIILAADPLVPGNEASSVRGEIHKLMKDGWYKEWAGDDRSIMTRRTVGEAGQPLADIKEMTSQKEPQLEQARQRLKELAEYLPPAMTQQ